MDIRSSDAERLEKVGIYDLKKPIEDFQRQISVTETIISTRLLLMRHECDGFRV